MHLAAAASSSPQLLLLLTPLFILVSTTAVTSSCTAMALSAEWIDVTPSSQTITPRRSGHTAFTVSGGPAAGAENKNIPFVFGGYVEVDDNTSTTPAPKKNRYVVNDLWQFESSSHQWDLVATTGDIPGPRLCSAAAAVKNNNKAYLFGGWDPQDQGTGGVILDTVHELDIAARKWTELVFCRMPDGPTSRHVAVALPSTNKILVHTHRCTGYVLLFDCDAHTFTKQTTTGKCPSSRGLHAATTVNDRTICIFGGAAQDQTMSNEAFLLDTQTWQWTRIQVNGSEDGPCPRAGPCIACHNQRHVLLFGGAQATEAGLHPKGDVWSLDVQSHKWTRLLETGPPARNAASLSLISHNEFLLAGGWAPFRETYDDCFVLKVSDE
jgi:N-acetylneuraminic acid mutarotase